MNEIINFGLFTLVVAVIVGIAISGVYLKRKFNIKDSEIEFGQKIIKLLSYLASKTGFSFSGDIEIVAKYVLDAIDFVQEFDRPTSIDEKRSLISEKTLQICTENNITVDTELVNAINEIVDYFINE
jgi:hypothetical protein